MTTQAQTAEPIPHNRKAVWFRGLYMLFFIIAIGLAQSLLNVIAIVQFLSMLIFGKANDQLSQFGTSLGVWLKDVAAFQAGTTETRPFPWSDWPQAK